MVAPKAGSSCATGCGIIIGVLVALLVFVAGVLQHLDSLYNIGFDLAKYYSYEEILFRNLDVNEDGWLSLEEFAAVAHKITPMQRERVDIEEKNVTLETFFQPLDMSSLRSFSDPESQSQMKTSIEWQGLLQWKTAPQTQLNTTNRKLSFFLPQAMSIDVGVPWPLFLTSDVMEDANMRYEPPPSQGIQAVIEDILSGLHPRPFLQLRFGPQGGHAVLKEKSLKHFDIAFRFHAEFQLNTPPAPPFWFTPAQFSGNVILSHNGEEVKHFHIYVPTKRHLNVDMEIVSNMDSPENVLAEIGFIPQMEIRTKDTSDFEISREDDANLWRESITSEEADKILDKAFNPFKQVEYLPFREAFERAREESKLVHSIVLWGALDDQSC